MTQTAQTLLTAAAIPLALGALMVLIVAADKLWTASRTRYTVWSPVAAETRTVRTEGAAWAAVRELRAAHGTKFQITKHGLTR